MHLRLQSLFLAFIVLLSFTSIGLVALNQPIAHQVHQNELLLEKKEQANKALDRFSDERVHLHIDKSLYLPGDDIWFQAYVLDELSMKPSGISDFVQVDLINPKNSVESTKRIYVRSGSGAGDFKLEENSAGGIYKIRAYTTWQKNDTSNLWFEKEFQVQNIVLPRLKMNLEFDKKSYGAGEEAQADLQIEENDNRAMAFHPFTYVVYQQGVELYKGQGSTDRSGKASVSYQLPEDASPEGWLLNVLFEYEGSRESIARSIPVADPFVGITFYPEGGDLAQGLTNRIAFKAKNRKGKSIDVTGYIADESGRKVTSFESYYNGTRAFSLKPIKGKTYQAFVTSPKGVETSFPLPESNTAAVTMRLESGSEEAFQLNLEVFEPQELSVVGMLRGKVFYTGAIHAKKGNNKISIPKEDFPMGVCRFTVFDQTGTALAERLSFAHHQGGLRVEITTEQEQYAPRDKVMVKVKTTNREGKPVAASLSVSVVDDQLISYANDKQSNILGKLLLEPELRGKVKDAAFYFDPDEEKAEKALDLLLMTRGWRKFSWKQIQQPARTVSHMPEKALYGAYVFENWTRKPIAGVKVSVEGMADVTTDKNGFFSFSGLDLSHGAVVLNLSKEGLNPLTRQVIEYGSGYRYYMTDPSNEIEFEEMNVVVREKRALRALNNVQVDFEADFAAVDDDVFIDPMAVERFVQMEVQKEEEQPMVEQKVVPAMDSIRVVLFDKKEFLGRKDFFAGKILPIWGQNTVYQVREFPALEYSEEEVVTERTDFNSTVYWKGDLETNRLGKAEFEFYTNDLISSFRISAEGFGANGQLACGSSKYFTQLPFSMKVKIPVTASFGDRIEIPVTIKNNTQERIDGALRIQYGAGLEPLEALPNSMKVDGFQTLTYHIPFLVKDKPGASELSFSFTGEGVRDALKKEVLISAKGFPQHLSFSGDAFKETYQAHITQPIEGSVKTRLQVFPNITGEMLAGVESILREPSGCFEQTSSSTYPNIMVMQYLNETGNTNAQVSQKAQGMIDRGYKRLTSYETSEKGYEWFGSSPPHEALTAYGLMEFMDMKEVYGGVDENMLERTKGYLLNRKDGKGGFLRNARALDRFGSASEEVTNAYIVWALSEAGVKEVDMEYEAMVKKARKKTDAYQLALSALAAFNLGKKEQGTELSALLKAKQNANGSFSADESITRSGGVSLEVEATSLAVLALYKEQKTDKSAITKAVDFIVKNRSFGGYGATQSTVLALKALTQFAKDSRRTQQSGKVGLLIDGSMVQQLSYKAGEQGTLEFNDFSEFLEKGKHKIEVVFSDTKEALPYALDIEWTSTLPASSKDCVLNFNTRLEKQQVRVGEVVALKATVENTQRDGLPMTMAKLGIPGGLSAQPWQLKELQEKGVIDFYETSPDYVICYFRDMAPKEKVDIQLDLKAEIPGSYEAPASNAYLYYTNELKTWKQVTDIKVLP